MSIVAKVNFSNYQDSISKVLDIIEAKNSLPQKGLIIIKPNLTNASLPPVTTNVQAIEAIYIYCKKYSSAQIVIGEGCGSGMTSDVLKTTGYDRLAKKHGTKLFDFNSEEAVKVKRDDTFNLKEFYIPKILLEAYIISVPVLKDHSFTKTTIAMKNMFGIAPAPYYQGGWNKSKLHSPSTDQSVVDVCLYKRPDLSIVDANIALTGSHLWGIPKAIGKILASYDPVAIDAVGSELLGHDKNSIKYLKLANNILGSMDNIEIIK